MTLRQLAWTQVVEEARICLDAQQRLMTCPDNRIEDESRRGVAAAHDLKYWSARAVDLSLRGEL